VQKNKRDQVYYVVLHGRKPGIYKNHKQAVKQVNGFPNGSMKKVRGIAAAKKLFYEGKTDETDDNIYYVVKHGRNPGIYSSRKKALQQIKGFPHAVVKKIKGYERAKAYFHGRRELKKAVPNIYIDGSYIQDKSYAGYGFVVELDRRIIAKDGGTILDHDIINMHSLGSELYAYIRAMEWAMANEYKKIRIIYDSKAIIDTLKENENGWKQPKGKAKLLNLYSLYRKHVQVEHRHKNSHIVFRERHQEAHHLSQLTSIMLHDDHP